VTQHVTYLLAHSTTVTVAVQMTAIQGTQQPVKTNASTQTATTLNLTVQTQN